jgi:hypothetical protein
MYHILLFHWHSLTTTHLPVSPAGNPVASELLFAGSGNRVPVVAAKENHGHLQSRND